MGIFEVFKRKRSNQILSPCTGELLELSCVPDEVFSNKMLGDGFAIKSKDGLITSPVNGSIELVFDTKHAIGIKSTEGVEILIHLGIDTVKLNGKGFEVFVNEKDVVKAGDKIAKMDIDFIMQNAKTDISPVIFTNLESAQSVNIRVGNVEAKEENRIEII